jgi:lambda repressor-like predicted transcriptional regulator
MRHISNYGAFKEFLLKESNGILPNIQEAGKLNQAADIIASFLNKKTKKDYKKYPFVVNSNGIPGIMLYSDKDTSAVRVGGKGNGPGIVGELAYFSDASKPVADFVMTSDKFPIVALCTEFAKLIDEPSYVEELESIKESLILEGRGKTLNPKDQQVIMAGLKKGESIAALSKRLGVPYSAIYKLKKNTPYTLDEEPAIIANEQTLEDKVKYLDETLTDIYDIARKVGAGAFNSLMISGRAGTGKTYSVTKALKDEGLEQDEDFLVISGAVSVIMMFKKMYQYRTKTLVFDDCDAVFRDENGRNILKAALDTKKIRRISYLKKSSFVFDPKDFENNPEGEFNAIESGLVPAYFDFAGRVIFISNLAKDKADPDGAIRSRSILIDVNPDDATLMERIQTLLPFLEPVEMAIKDKEEIFEFMKKAKDVSMRTFVKAAGFKQSGLKNWERMSKRYL